MMSARLAVLHLLLLLLPICAGAQHLSTDDVTHLRNSVRLVDADTVFNDSNWEALASHLENKRFVMIGEFTHGASEIHEIRNSLVRYLHQRHGFDVILFESGIGELINPNFSKEELSAQEMTYGFFGAWRARPFINLMQYVKDNALDIAGYDVQRTGRSFQMVHADLIYDSEITDPDLTALEERFTSVASELRSGGDSDSLLNVAKILVADYRKLKTRIDHTSDIESRLAEKTLENRAAFLEYYSQFNLDRDWNARFAARDSMMAENLRWLSTNLFNGRKVMVIGHNYHIARYNEKETVMGELLPESLRNQSYVIGTFAGSGYYADNAGRPKEMAPPDSSELDLKHVIQTLDGYAHFVHFDDPESSQRLWFSQPVIVNDTFIDLSNSNSINLARHFDGVLLLKQVTASQH